MPAYTKQFKRTDSSRTTYTYQSNGNQALLPVTTGPTVTIQKTLSITAKTKTGVSNPRWKSQIKQHIDATTPFTAGEDIVVCQGSGSASVTKATLSGGIITNVTQQYNGFFANSAAFSNTAVSAVAAEQTARAKLYNKLYQNQVTFQGGVFLAEFREALHMIKHPAEGLVSYIRNVGLKNYRKTMRSVYTRAGRRIPRSHRKDPPNRVSKALADLWLEQSFGWRPFMSDIRDGMDAYNKIQSQPEYTPFKVFGTDRTLVSPHSVTQGSMGNLWYTLETYRTSEATVCYFGEFTNKVNGPAVTLGLSWGNFVPTVWEALPFSFLADYFVNIGKVLEASFVDLSAIKRVAVVQITKAVSTTKYGNFQPINNLGLISSASGGHPDFILIRKNVSRSPYVSLSIPNLRWSPPLSATKWANMGALITGLYNPTKIR